MNRLNEFVRPTPFDVPGVNGNIDPNDFTVTLLGNGGYATEHIPTGRQVPHVLARPGETAESLQAAFSGGPTAGAGTIGTLSSGLAAAVPALAAANLGVGLLNLGVSTWTAYKVYKMNDTLDDVADTVNRVEGKIDSLSEFVAQSVKHLDGLIRENAAMLGVLSEGQAQLGEKIDVLRYETARGFASMRQQIQSVEAKREAKALEQQMRALFGLYETCSDYMKQQSHPPDADLRRIVDKAVDLISWVETRLDESALGTSHRLPYHIARVFAVRLEVDARTFLYENDAGLERKRQKTLRLLRQEVRAISQDATLYDLAVKYAPVFEQYVYLARSLNLPATTILLDDGSTTLFYPEQMTTWDDELGEVRTLLETSKGQSLPDQIELKTLQERNAWRKLAALPHGYETDHVAATEFKRIVGLPEDTSISAAEARTLLQTVPKGTSKAKATIQQAI